MTSKGIIIIERYEKGALTVYSVDDGKTFHNSKKEAIEAMTAPNTSGDWLDEVLTAVRDAGAIDDNYGAENWTLSDMEIAQSKAAIQAHFEKQAVERERAARIDEVSRISRGKIMGVGDVMVYRSTRIAALNNKEEEK